MKYVTEMTPKGRSLPGFLVTEVLKLVPLLGEVFPLLQYQQKHTWWTLTEVGVEHSRNENILSEEFSFLSVTVIALNIGRKKS